MANPVCEVLLTELPLAAPADAGTEETGAVVDFWGVVRRTENGVEITGIMYEAHRAMAEHQLQQLGEEAAEQFGLQSVAICHRFGFVPVAEASLLVRVCSKHRADAFRGAQWTVDELKNRAPIWKHPQLKGAEAGATLSVRDLGNAE